MQPRVVLRRFLLLLPAFAAVLPAAAQVERLEIASREPYADGRAFGLAGPYEVLRGTVHFAADPESAADRRVVDLDKAPRDADGKVRYRADFSILKPVDASRGNGAVLLDVVNRGGSIALGFDFPNYQFQTPQDPAGDGWLLRHGFTVAAVGWQADVPEGYRGPFTIRLEAPRAAGVEGLVRAETVFDEAATTMTLSHWGHVPYEVADPEDPRNVLTVRDAELDERRPIARASWRFAREEDGAVVPSRGSIYLDGGFTPGRIYEAVYVARDPFVVGLGLTALRDFTSYLKHGSGTPVAVDRALAFGGSQTARVLRHLLYQGFNADRDGRRVLDGVFSLVGGAGRGSFNHRFAQPSRAAAPFTMFHYPTDQFPFTGTAETDPVTGRSGSLLEAAQAAGVAPKIFHVNSSSEYWNRAASLLHVTVDGQAEIEPSPDERIYNLASTQHFGVALPPPRSIEVGEITSFACAWPMNPAVTSWVQRALLLALDAWVARGEEPPPSVYPRLGELTTPEAFTFPAIPGVTPPHHPYVARRLDYGPRFASEGVVDRQPPAVGAAFAVEVPVTDADGNDVGGLRLPEIAVPLATYASWNLRDPATGGAGELCILTGSFFPFHATRAAREAAGDPRPAVAERYGSRDEYVGRYAAAAVKLIRDGYLLAEDLPAMVEHAGALWDLVQREDGDGEDSGAKTR